MESTALPVQVVKIAGIKEVVHSIIINNEMHIDKLKFVEISSFQLKFSKINELVLPPLVNEIILIKSQIKNQNLQQLYNVTSLFIQDFQFQNNYFILPQWIITCIIQHSNLKEVMIDQESSIQNLSLAYNNNLLIDYLPSTIQELDLSYCGIKTFNIESLKALVKLQIVDNTMPYFYIDSCQNKYLTEINFGTNVFLLLYNQQDLHIANKTSKSLCFNQQKISLSKYIHSTQLYEHLLEVFLHHKQFNFYKRYLDVQEEIQLIIDSLSQVNDEVC